MSELSQLIAEQVVALNEQRRLGMDFMREEAARDVRILLACYDRAIKDPDVKIPTALHMAVELLREKYAPRHAEP